MSSSGFALNRPLMVAQASKDIGTRQVMKSIGLNVLW
jgi:hypothetical protein